jgi:general secretion pathway protein L
MSAARLNAALPALVEERVIADLADCAIAAGPLLEGRRLLAVTDVHYLRYWLAQVRQHGAVRIKVLPLVLCLAWVSDTLSACVIQQGGKRDIQRDPRHDAKHESETSLEHSAVMDGSYELVLRAAQQEGLGLALAAGSIEQVAAEVLQLLRSFAAERRVDLSVPGDMLAQFRVAGVESSLIQLRASDWKEWIAGAASVPLDLAQALQGGARIRVDWGRWRWPVRWAAALALLHIVALNAQWWQVRSEGLRLRASMVSLYQQAYPNESVIDPLAQLRQKLVLRQQASGESAPSDFLALAASLGDGWPELGNTPHAIASLEYRNASLQVQFKPGNVPTLELARPVFAIRHLEIQPVANEPAAWLVRSAP